MLKRIWQKLAYRLYVCRVTIGAHIEHSVKNLRQQAFRIYQNISVKFLIVFEIFNVKMCPRFLTPGLYSETWI